jgi:8-oxo-dGTP pyrophosphatase MutT (NUDIX family)
MSLDQDTKRRLKVQVWVYWIPSGSGVSLSQEVKILLLKTIPERGSLWQPVTGGVDAGEEIESAARREAWEETGLSFRHPLCELSKPFEFESRFGPAVEYPYAFEVNEPGDQPPQVRLDSREHDQYVWLSPKEAQEKIQFPAQVEVLQCLIDRINQKNKEN